MDEDEAILDDDNNLNSNEAYINTHVLSCTGDSIPLSPILRSWIAHVGANVEQYERALFDAFSGKKQRYYRLVGDENKINDPTVQWLRDVDIFSSVGGIDKSAVGIDASSAAIVDSLRLGRVCNNSEVWILDMCCAPGGKLLATINTMKRFSDKNCKWNVIGLDLVKRRLDVCKSLLKKECVDKSKVVINFYCCNSQYFNEFNNQSVAGKYDRIILDVECTHEGSLRSVVRTLKYWDIKSLESRWTIANAKTIIENQKNLLRHAISLIKPGGFIVYSTCSLDINQNELLVSNVIKEFTNVYFYPLPIHQCSCCNPLNINRIETWPISSSLPLLESHCPDEYFYKSQDLNCKNSKSPPAIRFDPMKSNTDGLFITCITKKC